MGWDGMDRLDGQAGQAGQAGQDRIGRQTMQPIMNPLLSSSSVV